MFCSHVFLTTALRELWIENYCLSWGFTGCCFRWVSGGAVVRWGLRPSLLFSLLGVGLAVWLGV